MDLQINKLKIDYNAIKENLKCSVTDDDYERIKEKLKSLQDMARIENRSISVYDLHREEFLLKVDKHIELLGYGSGSVNIHDVDNYHNMIHMDDVPFLYDSEIKMYRFLKPVRDDSKKDYKLVYDYRVRAQNGQYFRFLHQLMLFELDKSFNSWLLLIISDLISKYPDNQEPRRFLIHTKTSKICLFNEEMNIKSYLITSREKEVLELLLQGLDSHQISDKLCISTSTVNNHRQNILSKTKTKNTTQAAIYLKTIGIL